MSDDIHLDRDNMMRRIGDLLARVDDLDKVLADRPAPVDGGVASAMIGFITVAGAQAAGTVADTHRALSAVVVDVLDDMTLTDAQVGDAFLEITDDLDER